MKSIYKYQVSGCAFLVDYKEPREWEICLIRLRYTAFYNWSILSVKIKPWLLTKFA